jgi:hypothetical protein
VVPPARSTQIASITSSPNGHRALFLAACLALATSACSGGGGGGSTPPPGGTVTLSGLISYDRVPFNVNVGFGLDYAATVALPVREVDVELLQSNQTVLATTRTGTDGRYQFTAPAGTDVFLRARARTQSDPASSSGPSWDLQILDNTQGNAQYVLDGTVFNTGAANGTPTRDLRAPSGWGATSYVDARSAGPFALLDTLYSAVQFVLGEGDPAIELPPLDVFWSPQNTPADGDPRLGQIGTTSFRSAAGGFFERGIYVLGDDGLDTDEYDVHVLAHEFNHFLENSVSRSDSPGGDHGPGDRLDLRVAFSEGLSNAFSGMVLGDPVYRDSLGASQSDEFGFDLEANAQANPGWFSEGSVQAIVWDLFDAGGSEGNDLLALGYVPLLDVLRNEVRTGQPLTSLFPFVVALKQRSGVDAAAVDALVAAQDIVAVNMDAFGGTETHNGGIADALPIYTDIALNGGPVVLCSTNAAGSFNVLGNRRFMKFSVPSERLIDIQVANDSAVPADPDPDLVLWESGLFAISECAGPDPQTGCTEQQNIERYQQVVPAGDYVLEIYEFSHFDPTAVNRACMNVTVTG